MADKTVISRDSGFSVLEALIAIAILAVAFLPLLDLQMQFVQTTQSIERAYKRDNLKQAVINRMSSLNFSLSPEGEYMLNDYRAVWRSEEIQANQSPSFLSKRFDVKLYRVRVTLEDQMDSVNMNISLTGVGWQPRAGFEKFVF